MSSRGLALTAMLLLLGVLHLERTILQPSHQSALRRPSEQGTPAAVPSAAVPGHTPADDEERFRSFILQLQRPADCSSAPLYLWKGAPWGFGSQVRNRANSFLEALTLNRTFVSSHVQTQWVGKQACTSQSWSCIFLPEGSCNHSAAFLGATLPGHQAMRNREKSSLDWPKGPCHGCLNAGPAGRRVLVGRSSCTRFDAAHLRRAAGLADDHPNSWYYHQVAPPLSPSPARTQGAPTAALAGIYSFTCT